MERDEIEKLLLCVLPSLKSYALTLTGDDCRADDLLQETVLKILNNRGAYVLNFNFKGWAATIMHNIFINESKRSSRCVNISDDSFFDAPFDDCVVDSREIIGIVSRLPLSFRVPLEMFVGGYKYCEIAERMNVPIGTVKSRINKARSCLRGRFMV